ncbi:MAG TPA: hypothetical protein VM032_02095 [Vicinamibacterales bacterium]|nr:hypothetical protein [Vicinamibacterales bacterium]
MPQAPQPTKPAVVTRSARVDERHLIDVPASGPWTDSGVTLRTGDRVDIRAWGRVRFTDVGSGVENGPAGAGAAGGCAFVVVNPTVPARALIANVAPALTFDGSGFLVGSSWRGTTPISGASAAEGRLFLGVNHDAVSCDRGGFDSWRFRNNSGGSFTVQLTVQRAGSGK